MSQYWAFMIVYFLNENWQTPTEEHKHQVYFTKANTLIK